MKDVSLGSKKKSTHKKLSFVELLNQLIKETKEHEQITFQQIFDLLSGKGYAALMILFSLPFCLPIQIPGFSVPFGIVLGFLGLRLALGKRPWWPQWILKKGFKSEQVASLTEKTIKIVRRLQKVLQPRLVLLTKSSFCHRLHGILLFTLSFLLAIPIPIPLTNMLTAFPILFLGLGLLEDDGLSILIAYFLAFICFGAFFAIYLWSKSQLAFL